MRTFWYKGLTEIKEKWQVRKKGFYLVKIVAHARRMTYQKTKCIWGVNTEQIQYKMKHQTCNIKY